jgi:hypothetical protein
VALARGSGHNARVTTHEREITAPVALVDTRGDLRPDAIGFSRRPLHDARLAGHPGRKKRWDYWCVQTRECALQVTLADLDYLGLVEVSLTDFATGRVASAPLVLPLALGLRLPDAVEGGDVVVRTPRVRVELRPRDGAMHVVVRVLTLRGLVEADVEIARPPHEESLNVVVPFGAGRFQLTSKHVARPATGHVRALGRSYVVDDAHDGFGCLDYGRGVWPTETAWNWGTAAARIAGVGRVGLQLGGKWTDGTGATENGVFLDGRLDKLGAALAWDYDRRDFMRPWTVSASGVAELTFTPILERRAKIHLGIGRSELHLCFGRWRGVVHAHGRALAIDDALGWAEEHRARW